jgi:hypothetical protein
MPRTIFNGQVSNRTISRGKSQAGTGAAEFAAPRRNLRVQHVYPLLRRSVTRRRSRTGGQLCTKVSALRQIGKIENLACGYVFGDVFRLTRIANHFGHEIGVDTAVRGFCVAVVVIDSANQVLIV